MRNGGFRISSWTGLCAGSAGIQLIGRQLKFQLSSSFNLLHNISQHWFRKYPQTTSQLLSLKQRTWFPNTKHTHVCVCVSTSHLLPRLWFQHYHCLLCGPFLQRQTPKQCITCTSKFYRTPPAFIDIYIYICIVSALSAKNKKAYDVYEMSQSTWI